MIERSSQIPEVDVGETQEPVEISRRKFLGRMGKLLAALTAIFSFDKVIIKNPYLRTPPPFPSSVLPDNSELQLPYDYSPQTLALVESGINTASSEYFLMEPSALLGLLEQICATVDIKTREVLPVFAFWAANKATWMKQVKDSVVNSVQYGLNQSGLLAENSEHGYSRRALLTGLIGNQFLAEKIDVVPTVGFYDKEPSLYAHAWIRGLQEGKIEALVQKAILDQSTVIRMNALSLELINLEARAQAVDATNPANYDLIDQYKKSCNEMSIFINHVTRGLRNRKFDLCLFGLYVKYVQNIVFAEFRRFDARPSPAQLVYLTLVGSDSLYMESSTLEKRISGINSFTHPVEQLRVLIANAQSRWGLLKATPEKLDELFYGHDQSPSLYCQWSQV